MNKMFTLLFVITISTLSYGQVMTFNTGATDSGFILTRWTPFTGGTICMTDLSTPTTVSINSGVWNFDSFDVEPFIGNNTMRVKY